MIIRSGTYCPYRHHCLFVVVSARLESSDTQTPSNHLPNYRKLASYFGCSFRERTWRDNFLCWSSGHHNGSLLPRYDVY